MLETFRSKKTGLWYYDHSKDNKYRYTLGRPGKNPLICFGINPSTAIPDNLDATLKRVEKRSQNEDFDGWIMLNIFPLREKNPCKLPQQSVKSEADKNIKIIYEVICTYPDCKVWAAWGNSINLRPYLSQCFCEIYNITKKFSLNWVTVKLCEKSGNPHHPIGLRYTDYLQRFDIEKYFNNKFVLND